MNTEEAVELAKKFDTNSQELLNKIESGERLPDSQASESEEIIKVEQGLSLQIGLQEKISTAEKKEKEEV